MTKNEMNEMNTNSPVEFSSDELQQAQLELYAKLGEAKAQIAVGAKGEDFFVVAERLRKKLLQKLYEAK